MADGGQFYAVVEITDKSGAVLAAVGQPCDQVDPAALGWLAQCGAIAPIPTVADSVKDVIDG